MRTVSLPWNALEPGFRVLLKGMEWTVRAVNLEEVTVTYQDRQVTRDLGDLENDAQVVLDARVKAVLDAREANAEKLLQEALGAERVALGDPFAQVLVEPVQWVNEADLRMHLNFLHGMYVNDVKKVHGDVGLLAAHDWSHGERDRPRYIPHVHHDR